MTRILEFHLLLVGACRMSKISEFVMGCLGTCDYCPWTPRCTFFLQYGVSISSLPLHSFFQILCFISVFLDLSLPFSLSISVIAAYSYGVQQTDFSLYVVTHPILLSYATFFDTPMTRLGCELFQLYTLLSIYNGSCPKELFTNLSLAG